MFIDNKEYRTDDLSIINSIRYALVTNIYNDPSFIENLTDIISKNIDCLSIDYHPDIFSFAIKIKKTSMRKMHGFKHNTDFYYNIIPNIFKEFIKLYENNILEAISFTYPNPSEILQRMYDNPNMMLNLCLVSCISDNIIMIKL